MCLKSELGITAEVNVFFLLFIPPKKKHAMYVRTNFIIVWPKITLHGDVVLANLR